MQEPMRAAAPRYLLPRAWRCGDDGSARRKSAPRCAIEGAARENWRAALLTISDYLARFDRNVLQSFRQCVQLQAKEFIAVRVECPTYGMSLRSTPRCDECNGLWQVASNELPSVCSATSLAEI